MCHGPLQQQTRPSCHAGDNSSFPFAFESRPRRRFTIRWSTTIHTAVPMHTLRASHSLKEGCRKPVLGVWPMQPPCIVCCLMSRSDRRRSRGVERGSARRSSLKGREGHRQSDECWNCFKGNVGDTSERPGWSAYGLFERIDPILN